jgi:hypothetical protein
VIEFGSEGCDGFEDGLEEVGGAFAFFDLVIPPMFAVVVAIGLGEVAKRVDGGFGGSFIFVVAEGEAVSAGPAIRERIRRRGRKRRPGGYRLDGKASRPAASFPWPGHLESGHLLPLDLR